GRRGRLACQAPSVRDSWRAARQDYSSPGGSSAGGSSCGGPEGSSPSASLPPSAPTPTGVGAGLGSITVSLTSSSSVPSEAGSTITVEPAGSSARSTKSANGSSM